jgi:DNA-binding transcriptional MerR regulator
MPSRSLFSIGTVSRMVGVPVGTLRSWQDRYGLIVPERSSGGQRLFTREQVEHLRFVKHHLAAGNTPADAHRLLAEFFDEPGGEPKGASGATQSPWREDAGAAWPSEPWQTEDAHPRGDT